MSVAREFARRTWRLLPEKFRHRTAKTIINPAKQRYVRLMLARPLRHKPVDPEGPLVVAGLFRTTSGIGEGARSTYRMLKAEGRQPVAVCLSDAFGLADMESPIPLSQMPPDRHGTVIVHMNSPELPAALNALGLTGRRAWYVIGFWAWELTIFPPGWDRNFRLVSEIWTPSSFVTAALASHAKAPRVITKGHRICVPDNIDGNRAQFDLPEDAIVYLTFADIQSSLDRKNPFAAIDAFKKAFGHDARRILLIKTRNFDSNSLASRDLKNAIGGAPNIRLMKHSLSDAQKWALLKTMDCLIALHRSEGFGLPIAEAIALGKKVFVTAWSGNMDFCTPENAILVDYKLVPTIDRYGSYNHTDAFWAEPDYMGSLNYL